MKHVRILSCALISGYLSGCGIAYTPSMGSNGHVMLVGDAKGVRAFYNGQNGLITNGKATPNSDTSYWVSDRLHERESTKRAYAPSLLQGLFHSSPAQKDEAPEAMPMIQPGEGK